MQSAEVLYFNPCAFKTLCIKYLFVCVCHTGGVSAACSWVRLCPVRPLLVQDEGRLVTLALTDLVAIAVKNAFSSRCFWSFVKLWLMLRTVCAPFLANCCYAVVDPVFFPWWFAVWLLLAPGKQTLQGANLIHIKSNATSWHLPKAL